MAPNFTIDARPAPREIADLRESVGWSRDEGDYPVAFEGYVHTVAARDAGGELIGWLAVVGDRVHHAFLIDVIVHPAWQQRGVGSGLVRRALDAVREDGVRLVHVDFLPEHAAFYESVGFRPSAAGILRIEPAPGA